MNAPLVAPEPQTSEVTVKRPGWFLFGLYLFSFIGDGLRMAAFPLLVASRTNSGTRLGLVSSLEYVAAVLVTLIAGKAADTMDRRKLLIVSEFGLAITVGAIALTEALGGPTISVLYVAAPLIGGFSVFSNLAFGAGLPALVGTENVGRATSRLVASRWIGQVIGPVLMGIAFVRFEGRGVVGALVFDALTFAGLSACFGFVRVTLGPSKESRDREAGVGSKNAFHFVRREPGILRLLLFISVQNAIMAPLLGAMTFFFTNDRGESGANVGTAFSCFALGAVPGALLASRLGVRHIRWGLLMASALSGAAIVLASSGLSPRPVAIFACVAIAGAGYAFCVSLAHGVRVSLTPDAIRGRVGSMGTLVTDVITPVSLVAGGFLVDATNGRTAVCAIGIAASLLSVVWLAPWASRSV